MGREIVVVLGRGKSTLADRCAIRLKRVVRAAGAIDHLSSNILAVATDLTQQPDRVRESIDDASNAPTPYDCPS
jgi:hypothetical protein